MMPNWIVKVCQVILYPLVYLPFRILYKKEISIAEKFKKGEKYIFVANHPAKIDPFLMFYFVPFKELIKILPIRFMTAEKYMQTLPSYFFLSLIGCYKVNIDVLETSKKLLENKNSLCIFIEGKVNNGKKIKPKVGALYLEREVKDSYLVPVKIRYLYKKFRKTAEITFKHKLKHRHFPTDLQPLADELLEIIMK